MPEYNLEGPASSAWASTFTLKNNDRTLQDLTGHTFRFVIRPTSHDATSPPAIRITATPTDQGALTVTTETASVAVTLTAAAVALIGPQSWRYALWMDPDEPASKACVVHGTFTAAPVAAP